ncbi:class I SAM-dependent methyltransferase [Nocardioides sp.]|uniref:class I SAM-dependent DNA methyltransferase n=1 Tax=Nocardioides sp. TaxID=35761 RepID=UPI003526F127
MDIPEYADLWGADLAERYDADDAEMFAPEVLDPVLDLLERLADGGAALELAIGTGRVGVALHARGVPVSGIELSEPMVAQLRAKLDEAALPVVVGDMATARVPGEFSVVYLVYNTITNLLTQDAQVACFANAARHLRPGGAFVVECFVPPLRQLPPGQDAAPFHVSAEHVGIDTVDVATQLLTSHHFSLEPDGSYRRGESRHRYAWPAEMDLMARLAGMTLAERWADWDRSAYTSESGKHVSVWRTSPSSPPHS